MESTIIKRLHEGKFILIAEIGVNYYDIAAVRGISNMDAAKLMVKEAAEAGIHAVKFQTYKAGTLAAKASPSYWDRNEEPTASQYELFQKFDSFGENEYRELKEYADGCGIEFLSTAFDYESADYLDGLMNVYKISSSDLSNIPLIERAVSAVRRYNQKELVLLHCVLEYPTPLKDANLLKIRSLKEHFPEMYIGYSDHTKPAVNHECLKTAYNLGAQVIEKHFTLDKSLKGNDHYHAMDPEDAAAILSGIAEIDMMRGSGELRCLSTEGTARKNARRSIVAACNIPAGTVISREMLTFKRPGTGIAPSKIDAVAGAAAACDIPEDTIMQPEMLK